MSDIGCTCNWGSSMYEIHVPASSNMKVVTGSGNSSQPSGSFDTEDKSCYIMQNLCTRYNHTTPFDEYDVKIKFMAELGLCTTESTSNLVTAVEQCTEKQANKGTPPTTSSAGGSGTRQTSPREAKKSGVAGWTYDETKVKGPALDDVEDDGGQHASSKLKVRPAKKPVKPSQKIKKLVPKGLAQPRIPFTPQPHLYPASQEYGIDEILDKRVSDAGIEEYFIKWEGYSTDYNSWEARQNVSESAVLDYEKTKLQKQGKENTNSQAILNPPENRFVPIITWKPKLKVAGEADLTLKPTDQVAGNTGDTDSKNSAPTEYVQKLIYDLNPEVALNKGESKNLEVETNLEPMDEHFEHSSFGSNDYSGTASSSGSVVDISATADSNNGHGSDKDGPSHPKRPKRIIPQKLSPVPKPVDPKRKKPTAVENNIRKGWDDKYYVVEAIRDTRVEVDGTKSYLIKWVGYSSEENTWEPTESLTPELITHYEKKMAAKGISQAIEACDPTELNKCLDPHPHETPNGQTTDYYEVEPNSCISSGPALLVVPSGLTGRYVKSQDFDDEGYAILRTETNLAGRRVQSILAVTQYRNKIYFMVGFEGQDDSYTLVKGDDMNLVFPQEVLRFYENRISWSAMGN